MIGVCFNPLLLLMEWMPFGSLYKLLHERKNQEILIEQKLTLAIDIASAIDYIHKRQVVHRDIKSLNILVRETMLLIDSAMINLQKLNSLILEFLNER